mmetsp:Transcript_13008/g.18877  ORF Transcript_13008/g.18877 Transcript_13008/m.18877 type:complete len:373 (+) Transcript_13008:147-1265(+)
MYIKVKSYVVCPFHGKSRLISLVGIFFGVAATLTLIEILNHDFPSVWRAQLVRIPKPELQFSISSIGQKSSPPVVHDIFAPNGTNHYDSNESQLRDKSGRYDSHSETQKSNLSIAICSLSKSKPAWKELRLTPVFKFLVKSIHETTRLQHNLYDITIIIGVDTDDLFWQKNGALLEKITQTEYGMKLKMHSYNRRDGFLPFNELMRDAFKTNVSYMVRVNDDTEFKTSGWIPVAIEVLGSYNPPNIGIVGPTCRQGNVKILTHDMVHRSHLMIFDTYYPSALRNWYVDDWISEVYGSTRTTKIKNWEVIHHVELGTRYQPHTADSSKAVGLVREGKKKIALFLKETGVMMPIRLANFSKVTLDRRPTGNAKI